MIITSESNMLETWSLCQKDCVVLDTLLFSTNDSISTKSWFKPFWKWALHISSLDNGVAFVLRNQSTALCAPCINFQLTNNYLTNSAGKWLHNWINYWRGWSPLVNWTVSQKKKKKKKKKPSNLKMKVKIKPFSFHSDYLTLALTSNKSVQPELEPVLYTW